MEQPWIAGILAGFALWTKDKGALFLFVFVAALLVSMRRSFCKAAVAAVPVLAFANDKSAGGSPKGSSTRLGATRRKRNPE